VLVEAISIDDLRLHLYSFRGVQILQTGAALFIDSSISDAQIPRHQIENFNWRIYNLKPDIYCGVPDVEDKCDICVRIRSTLVVLHLANKYTIWM
jgi:hypothetical protein